MNDIWDQFIQKSGSRQWPSNNPDDSPCDRFICKHCDKIIKIQMYGEYHIDNLSFEEKAERILRRHMKNHESDYS